MRESGIRATREIYNRQDSEHSLRDVLEEINLTRTSLCNYQAGRSQPYTEVLRRMALAGYDIHYILTGERK